MSLEQGTLQVMIGISALLMYGAFNLANRHSVFSTFMFLTSLMFMPVTMFTAVAISDVQGFNDATISVISYSAYAIFIVAFFALLYFGIVVYMNDAFKASVDDDAEEFSFQTKEGQFGE